MLALSSMLSLILCAVSNECLVYLWFRTSKRVQNSQPHAACCLEPNNPNTADVQICHRQISPPNIDNFIIENFILDNFIIDNFIIDNFIIHNFIIDNAAKLPAPCAAQRRTAINCRHSPSQQFMNMKKKTVCYVVYAYVMRITLYHCTGEPPSSDGSSHASSALRSSFSDARARVGASGTHFSTTNSCGALKPPRPMALTARTCHATPHHAIERAVPAPSRPTFDMTIEKTASKAVSGTLHSKFSPGL